MIIYIVIPVHNRIRFTEECLSSLRDQSYNNFKTIVVDDGSSDGTFEMIKKEFPEIILLRGNGNLWWTGAINKGIQHVLSICNPEDYILVLNNDLTVPKDYIANAFKIATKYSNALIGSVVTSSKNKNIIYSGGILINWRTAKWQNINVGKNLSEFPKGFVLNVSTLTGRGTLIPSKVFKETGLYNNKHFLQCGDTELPIRAFKSGYKLVVSYDMVVFSCEEGENDINHREIYRLNDIKNYFCGIKSNMNIIYRFWFAYDSSSNIIQTINYFLFDLIRIIYHFCKKLNFKKREYIIII
jgi:GT2 family glycosyltransferase